MPKLPKWPKQPKKKSSVDVWERYLAKVKEVKAKRDAIKKAPAKKESIAAAARKMKNQL